MRHNGPTTSLAQAAGTSKYNTAPATEMNTNPSDHDIILRILSWVHFQLTSNVLLLNYMYNLYTKSEISKEWLRKHILCPCDCFAEKKKNCIPWRKYRTKMRVEMHLDVTWIHHWKKKGKKRTLTKPLRVRAVQGLSGLALLNVEPAVVKTLVQKQHHNVKTLVIFN